MALTFRQWLYRNVYLNSPGWKMTRWLFKGKFCQRCGKEPKARKIWMELHHEHYTWHDKHPILRYFLPNLWDDFLTLCNRCHKKG